MPYDEVQKDGTRVLCRTENFANVHTGFDGLLRGQYLIDIISQLAQEPMVLFKAKINYKLAGSGGFDPHIDATAYWHIKDVKHLTILLAVDATNMSNGGLEVVEGSHARDVPISRADNCIESSWVKAQTWVPVELAPGELLIFGSYLAHRSGGNESKLSRKAIYATYNCAQEGDLHDKYYEDRAVVWPATHMRVEGEKYEMGMIRYGFGSPILTVG
jgi:ectoine hydroxylase-related dioxygenase (phytanoyl-CoA dioxygenase family)